MSDFNNRRSNINKTFKNIELSIKELGQSANSYDDINEFDSILSSYSKRCETNICNYELLITSTSKALINERETLDYDYYSKFSFSKKNMNDELVKLTKRLDSVKEETEKIEKSIFGVFQKDTIDNNKRIIDELEKDIKILTTKIDIFDSEEYDFEWNTYKDLLDKLDKYHNAIKCLNIAKLLSDNISYSVNAYNKLKLVNEITEEQVISFKRLLKNVMNYILEKSEIIESSKIVSLNELLMQSKSIDDSLDYNLYLEDRDNLNIIVDAIRPSAIIRNCFNCVLNNKYLFTPDSLQKSKFERNDIVVLLYIFNKLGFSKRKQFNYLYIDEAQDYNDEEIKLINELESKPIMNIFGDYQQNISPNSTTRLNWNSLIESLNNNSIYYELNENYRNTTNVVEYCNSHINSKMTKIGIDGNDVKEINTITIRNLVDLYNNDKYQIITNDVYITNALKTINSKIKCNRVLDVKGLEFENIIVIDKDLDINNKYVAYTRTKNNLIIVHDVDIDSIVHDVVNNNNDISDINTNNNDRKLDKKELNNPDLKKKINSISNDNSMSEMTYHEYFEQLLKIVENNTILIKDFDIFFESNNISIEWQSRFIKDLSRENIAIVNFKEMDFNHKFMYIIRSIGSSRRITDEKLIELLIEVSDDVVERDKLYEYILKSKINIIEE